ncbi:MAG TPA: STAS domain-containing protein [Candidatus Sulfotelmatobacter sp.]|jgi:stage II sporulation protein AA (anti-sigma F factor antagonist)|nr:STAS domain-containing protein [Candidatus Sulfotelmatobacter sp.]
MNCELSSEDTRLVVSLSGRFTAVDTPAFRRVIEDLPLDGKSDVVFDLSDLLFVDSAALGLLVLARDAVSDRGLPMSIRNLQGQVKKTFELFHFDQLFAIQA